ncbi:response regulator transcription factor [Cohnella caldifontis]|uniref:response regulator transcription factor n=1 Tax=Cohnella caldifontis TaxID=3027471 RepID=UPI0023ECBB45|nr:helix-turn-helix transcriptional regulator [Cohnella sp. YIM B05605]
MIPPEDLLPIFEGVFPSAIVTGSAQGVPNVANLTRVWHVGSSHVAVADQLLNKTYRNLMECPLALLKMIHPQSLIHWEISVRYLQTENEGPLFERVRDDLLTVSWIAGVRLPAELRGVLVFEILNIRQCAEEALHLKHNPETYGDFLNALAAAHQWKQLSYWIPVENGQHVKLQASRGIPGAGVDSSVFGYMERLARLVLKERRVIRLNNIRSLLRYFHSMEPDARRRAEENRSAGFPVTEATPSHYLGLPVFVSGSWVGILCCEDLQGPADSVPAFEDRYFTILAASIGEALLQSSAVPEEERETLFRQAVERAKLQWGKEAAPFPSMLSARERQVALQVAEGLSNAEIAKRLFISPRTVTTHLERIFQKLNVPSRAALTRYVLEKNLFADEPEPRE